MTQKRVAVADETRVMDLDEILVDPDVLKDDRYLDVTDLVVQIVMAGGVQQPIAVDQDGRIVPGLGVRRYLACKLLRDHARKHCRGDRRHKWDHIPVQLWTGQSPIAQDEEEQRLVARVAANAGQKPLGNRASYEAGQLLEPILKRAAEQRQKAGKKGSADSAEGWLRGEVRDQVASALRMGRERWMRLRTIYETAEQAEQEGSPDARKLHLLADRLDADDESVNSIWIDLDDLRKARQGSCTLPELVPSGSHEQVTRAYRKVRRVRQARDRQARDVDRDRRIKRFEHDLTDITDDFNVRHGDCRVLAEKVESESVHLLFTDPPYLQNEIGWSYPAVVQLAERLLVPGGWLVVYVPTYAKPEILNLLLSTDVLQYRWEIAVVHGEPDEKPSKFLRTNPQILGWRIMHTSLVVLSKGEPRLRPDNCKDVVFSERQKDTGHPCQQSTIEAEHAIKALTKEYDLVLDPFCGSGTTVVGAARLNRRWMGMEIDRKWVVTSRHRLLEELQSTASDKEAG